MTAFTSDTAANPATSARPAFNPTSYLDIVAALEKHGCKPTRRGGGFTAKCPAHDDNNPSLDINPKADGGALMICRSQQCSFESIIDALGLKGVGYENPIKTAYHVYKGVKIHHPAYMDGDNLIVPVVDIHGNKRGHQTIWSPDSSVKSNKINSKGLKTLESIFQFGDPSLSETLLVATGYSTSASLYESTGNPVTMSLSDITLPTTIRLLRNEYAGKELIVCADFDARDNPAILDAVHQCKALLCFPTILGSEKADFNDLMLMAGKSAVCELVAEARRLDAPESRPDAPTSDAAAKARERPGKPSAAARIMTAAELWSRKFKPIRMIVEPFLPEGVTLLVSPPKIGKTRLATQLAIAIPSGGYALNHADTKVNKTEVLFLALESGDRRAQKDLKQMVDEPPDGLHIVTEWPRFSDGGVVELEHWLDQHPLCRFVIIDTVAKIRDRNHGGNGAMYTADYEAGAAIKAIADKREISFVLVHHTNKKDCEGGDVLDSVSGSTGVTGSVDHILILKRNRLEPDALMTMISRDFEDRQFAMTFDGGLWTLIGDPETAADDGWRGDGKSDARHEILSALRTEPLKPAELATRIGKNPSTTRVLLRKLLESGLVTKRFDGKYSVV